MAISFRLFTISGILLINFIFMVKPDDSCDIDIEDTLRKLLLPQDNPSLQVQALRKEILRRFQQALTKNDDQNDDDEDIYKRSLMSLARWNNLPIKRNLEALARAGYIRTLPVDDQVDDSNYKRNIANLAKTGQLSLMYHNNNNNNDKRGIEALARNGELNQHHQHKLIGDILYNKRNIASLARSGDLSSFKRSNVAALLRQDMYEQQLHNNQNQQFDEMKQGGHGLLNEKRNIASIKAHYPTSGKFKRSTTAAKSGDNERRSKRQVEDYYESNEVPLPVYQNQNVYDYEELMKELTGNYPQAEKRFLGSVAKSGWFRPTYSRLTNYQVPEKRHIGALARLGWLPSFRNVRRFNRSGRSTSKDTCRETTADGEIEDNSITKDTISLINEDNKRFLLQPAVNRILFKKIYGHPKLPSILANYS